MRLRTGLSLLLVASWLAAPASALAQDGLHILVTPTLTCASAEFSLAVDGDPGPFSLAWDFGDGDSLLESDIVSPHVTAHVYPAQGEYAWSLTVTSASGLTGSASGTVTISGPEVTLTSTPFPPLLGLGSDGTAAVDFLAEVTGGSEPYRFSWDLDGDGLADEGLDPASPSASFTYTQAARFTASVTVTDSCGLADSDTLPVVILEAEVACHPMAQRIADALNTLSPGRSAKAYTCEDIYNFFTGGWTGSQLGFGRMWHAYQLALVIDELTWEDILDWHLNNTGWGLLVQLDRIAHTLNEVPLTGLVAMVTSGEASIREIRQAFVATTRFDADFYDALSRLQDGANAGELSQFYRTAADLGLEPEALDVYLEQGLHLADVRHAAHVADQQGATLDEILAARLAGEGWGQIRREAQDHPGRGQGQAGEGEQVQEQVQDRERERNQDRDRHQEQTQNLERLTIRLAERLGIGQEQLRAVFEGTCAQDWSCAMTWLRSQARQQDHGRGRP